MKKNAPSGNPLTLRDLPLFGGLSENALEPLRKGSKQVTYARGEPIFSEDEKCRNLHVVLSGEVKIYKLSDDGKEHVIHVMRPGSFFGEDILFGGDRYEASAEALSDTTLLNVKKETMEALVLEQPRFAMTLLANFGRRLKRLMMLIGEVALQDVRKRLCRVLLEIAEEQPQGTFEHPLIKNRHADLAARVGTARETLSRTLGRLEQDGLIERRNHAIILRDRPGLLREVPHWREDVQLFPLDPERFRRA